jgi:cyanophycinase-like exopeptidase
MSKEASLSVPGPIVLFGSGETSPSGQKIFDSVMQQLPFSPRVALLETPAGFELNSSQVIGRVGEFITHNLQNYRPQVFTVHARNRDSELSPNNPEVVEALYSADMIFMGPGSPTYAVRQLRDSLAWQVLLARHRLGIALALASAAVVAISAFALPVYEIYKVGEDIHWKPGLDLFGSYGIHLVFIPHWNNNDGGEELDTSRCFMGQERFARLVSLLPPDLTIVGIDEKTGLVVNPLTGVCKVTGAGGVTLIHTGQVHQGASARDALMGTGLIEVAEERSGHVHQFFSGEEFSLARIGAFKQPEPGAGLPQEIWEKALEVRHAFPEKPEPSAEVKALTEERQAARLRKDWTEADIIRKRLLELGWQVSDTPDGPKLDPVK